MSSMALKELDQVNNPDDVVVMSSWLSQFGNHKIITDSPCYKEEIKLGCGKCSVQCFVEPAFIFDQQA